MELKRVQQLAGLKPLHEAEEKEEKDMMECPLCGEEFEHGKVLSHIKSDHKDAIKFVKDKMKEDEGDDDKEEDEDKE